MTEQARWLLVGIVFGCSLGLPAMRESVKTAWERIRNPGHHPDDSWWDIHVLAPATLLFGIAFWYVVVVFTFGGDFLAFVLGVIQLTLLGWAGYFWIATINRQVDSPFVQLVVAVAIIWAIGSIMGLDWNEVLKSED